MDLKQDYLSLFPFNLLCPYLKSVKIDAPERDKCKCKRERDRRVKRTSPLCLRVWVGLHVVVVALVALLSALENVQMNFLLVRDDER